jgi:hypothetical protein
MAIYEPLPGEDVFDFSEREEVYSTAQALHVKLNARRPLCGDEVTPEAFRDAVSTSHMVCFHGHCDFEKHLIAEQSLRLSNGEGKASTSLIY